MRAALALAALLPAAALAAPGRTAAGDAWQRYLERAKTLRRYRDDGRLDEEAVLRVLKREGVLTLRPDGADIPAGFHPFTVHVYGGLWRWPLKAGIVSSEFGRRWGRPHEGIDIAADLGDLVYAAAPGTVIYAGHGLRGYGNVVIIRHDDRTTTLYAHNSSLRVAKGDRVAGGGVIATVGSTGHSTGPHVHFEVRRGNVAFNPRRILPHTRF
ncbi:MAG: M23 family metallopeptidase [Elusimicrobia bacterium]|nr:M23 family metallopeptidase [Elusimicrobiota bacterium]